MKKILLSVVLLLSGITMQLTAQVNGTAARPLVSTAEKPVYYYIENQSATAGFTGNVLLPGTAVGQKLRHLPMPTDVESAKWQLVNEGGIVKLKHKQTVNFMSVSDTYSNTGDIFETNKYESQSYYKIRSGRQSPTLAYNNNLCNKQTTETDQLHWYFVVAPESQANYEELTASYFTDYGTYARSDNGRKLNSLSFTAAQNTTLAINQATAQYSSPVYFDKTTQVIEIVPGNSLTVSFNWTGSSMRNIAYVDWNNDKTFTTADDTERIGYNALAGSNTEMTKSITYAVPAGQALGDYRMRIMVDWFANHSSPNEAKFELLGNGGSVVDVILRVTNTPLPASPALSFGVSNLIVKGDAFTLTPPVGATVKYTTDDTDPATSPTAVTGTSVTANVNFKLRAISVKDGVNSPELVREIKTIDLTLGNEYYIVFQRYNATLALQDMGDGVAMQTKTLTYGTTNQRWTVSKGATDGLYKLTSIAGNVVYWGGSNFTVSATPATSAEVDMRFVISPNTDYSGYEIQRKASTGAGMNPLGGSAVGNNIGEYNLGDGGNVLKFMNTKGLLLTEIQKTQAIHDGAIEGSEFGQASASSKADLQSAITNAQTEYDKSTSEGDLTAITALQTAVINFKNIITDKNKLISSDATKYKWYSIRSTATNSDATYALGKVISSNGRILTEKFTFENPGTPVTDAQLFRFEISGSDIIIINKANGHYMAANGAISTSSTTFALNLLTDGYSFNIKPAGADAIHAQAAGLHIVNWAGDAGSASAWVFDFVKETYAPANITWRGESGNGNWWNEGGNDGDKHWWNSDNSQALTRPDIVVWNDTEYTGNNIQFTNNVHPAMNVNGAAFKVNSITFDIGASVQRVFIPVDNGSVNFVGLPSLIVNNSTPTHAFNLPVEISGTNLTVNTASGHIAINGVISGSGSLTKTGGHNLYISGANTYAGKTTVSEGKLVVEGNMTLASLEIAEGATLEVASGKQLTVTGAVTNNGTIVLKSDATNGAATLVGNVGGNAIVEQAVESSRNYYVGVPIEGAVVPTGIGNKVATFTESTDLWTDYAAAGPLTSAVAGQGYLVQVPSTSQLISFSGTLNNGDKSATLSSSMRRFNFLGNPYPSYVDGGVLLNGLTVEQTLWYYSKEGTGYTFKTVNTSTNVSTDNVDKRIAPMQGFWVRANVGTTPTVSFKNTNRMHKPTDGNANIGFRAPQATDYQMLRLQVSNNTLKDVAIVMFSENSTSDWNSSKMMNPSLNVYTQVNGNELAINSNTAIPYDVETTVGLQAPAGEYTISATEFSNFSTDKVYLLDKVTGISTDLSSGGSYTVNLTADYKGTDRFALVFPRAGVPTGLESAAGTTFVFVRNNRVVVNSDALGSTVYVFNGVGQQVASQAITGATTEVSKTLSAGVYVVKVNNETVKVVVK